MRMPTRVASPLTFCALIAAAAMMTACSGQQPTAPSSSTLVPNGRSESGYVVAEREPSDTTVTSTVTTPKKKPTTKP
jgi:hypothetical protein